MYSLWKSGKNKVRGLQKRINLKINFLLGTKAQFIKTIPVINEAIKRGLDVTLFDLKQHAKTTEGLKEKIDDKCNFINLDNLNYDLGTYMNLFKWFFKNLIKAIFIPIKSLKSEICIVHGDTLSTLLGVITVKRNRGTLVLLEAGHKVPGVFMHFPESIIRYISAKFSDYLISNGKDQLEQLSRWKVKGEIKEISTNTIHDSVLETKIIESNKSNRVLVSIHRTENLNNKNNMELLVNTLCKISKNFSITWCLHIPTKNKLIRYGFYKKLKKEGIELINLLPYEIFVNNIFNSEFVITDGGGVVEECQIIGTPTLVWRNEHLDQNHIFQKGKNLTLSNYDKKTIEQFIMNYKELIQNTESKTKYNPSVEVVDILTKI